MANSASDGVSGSRSAATSTCSPARISAWTCWLTSRTFTFIPASTRRSYAHESIGRSIIDLGHNLSLRVVGEGIETAEVLAALRAGGCDLAQGFLLARPMPAASLPEWLSPEDPHAEPELAPA